MSAPLLAIQDLAVRFAAEDGPVQAVDGITVDIARGATLGLVGESGCGKTAAMLAVMGLLPRCAAVSGGRVLLDDVDLMAVAPGHRRRLRGSRMAMVFQDPMTALNPYHRIGRQVAEALVVHGRLGWRAARRRAVELLAEVGIPDPQQALDRHPHAFSGGQRQRICVAMALACDPELVIADEPTTALDVTIQAQILDLLRARQQARGMALVLITHDLGVVAGTCDTVAVMYAGRIIEQAPTARLFSHPCHPYTRGLLAAIPRLEGPLRPRLATIPGLPPRLDQGWQGCAFAPRCPWVEDACRSDPCAVRAVSPEHRHRCRRDLTGTDFPVISAVDVGEGAS